MNAKEFISELKVSKEKGSYSKEFIILLRELIIEDYKSMFPFNKDKSVPEDAIKKAFQDIDKLWPTMDFSIILNPIEYFKTIIKSAINDYKRSL